MQADYAAWLDRVPKPPRDSATDEALQAIIALDLDELLAGGFGPD